MNKNLQRSASSDFNSLIDSSVLIDALDNQQEQIRKFFLLFLESTKESLAEIDVALNRSDLESVSAIGHRIQSAAKTVDALRFTELCYQLEQLKHGGSIKNAVEIAEKMQSMLVSIEHQNITESE